MAKIFHIFDEVDEKSYGRSHHDEMIEKVFKEGCEHGYHKAMKEMESLHEKGGRLRRGGLREDVEDKIEKLKEKYK